MRASIAGHDVFYDELGSGQPVICLHGGSICHASLRPWLDPLAQTARVIFYDQYGLGRSERPDDYSAITNATWVDELDALRAHLGLKRTTLLGHSYGGYIALEYALAHPERVAGLVLVSTAAALDYAPEVIAQAEARSTPEQFTAIRSLFHHPEGIDDPSALRIPSSDDDLRDLWEIVLPVYAADLSREQRRSLLAPIVYAAKAHNHQVDTLLPRYDVSARLGEINVPTLVIAGGGDFLTTPAAAERLRRGITGSDLLLIKDAGHFPFVSSQTELIAAVQCWLDRHDADFDDKR